MKRKQLAMKLRINKETLRNLSDRDLMGAVGGATALCTNYCEPTGLSDCYECGGPGTTAFSGGSCPSGPRCC